MRPFSMMNCRGKVAEEKIRMSESECDGICYSVQHGKLVLISYFKSVRCFSFHVCETETEISLTHTATLCEACTSRE